jgi:4'-phosphopantetheinyl transferase
MFAPRRLDAELPVFSLSIPAALLSREAAFDWLGDEELARVRMLGSAQRRAQFACGRWLLHHAVRQIAGGERSRVAFPEGRPVLELQGSPAAASISHSGNLVLCALGRVARIGVDVEQIRPRRDWGSLAQRVLHPVEVRRLAALTEAERWQGFYLAWTRKEALAKALGIGLKLPFARILLSSGGELEEAREIPGLEPAQWRLSGLEAGPGLAAGLAWRLD